MPALLFIGLLGLLYLSSTRLTRKLGQQIFHLTGNKDLTIYLLALLFLPGTFIHEMSHLITATFLGVRTGVVELIPRVEGSRVIMGSVPIAATDRVRRAVVGAAPFFVGMGLLLAIGWWVTNSSLDVWMKALAGYICFQVGNTCFASSRDLEGTLELILVAIFVVGTLYFLGFTTPVTLIFDFVGQASQLLINLDWLLAIPLMFNLLILFLFKLAD
jgi:hypothetical protein